MTRAGVEQTAQFKEILLAMGGNSSKISKQDLEVYKQLTFFTEKEIFKCCKRQLQECQIFNSSSLHYRFGKLVGDEIVRGVDSIIDERCKVSMENAITTLNQLTVNPFAFCLCQVFAQNGDFLLFEEFLDMIGFLGLCP